MSRAFVTKTSFTAGELDPLLLGRLDLKAQEDGAARLRNVVVHPTGGVSRRPGLRLVAALPGALRLVTFDGPTAASSWRSAPYRLDILRGTARSSAGHRHALGTEARSPTSADRALGRPAPDLPPAGAAQGAGRNGGRPAAQLCDWSSRPALPTTTASRAALPVRAAASAGARDPGSTATATTSSPCGTRRRSSPASPSSHPTASMR